MSASSESSISFNGEPTDPGRSTSDAGHTSPSTQGLVDPDSDRKKPHPTCFLEKNNKKTSLALCSACASRRAPITCDSRCARACVREKEGRDKRNARRVRRQATHHHPRQVDAPRPRSQSRKQCHDRRAWPGHSPGLGALPSVCSRGSPRRQPAERWIPDRATPPWSGLGWWCGEGGRGDETRTHGLYGE